MAHASERKQLACKRAQIQRVSPNTQQEEPHLSCIRMPSKYPPWMPAYNRTNATNKKLKRFEPLVIPTSFLPQTSRCKVAEAVFVLQLQTVSPPVLPGPPSVSLLFWVWRLRA